MRISRLWRRAPAQHNEAHRAAVDATEQLRAAEQNRGRVRDDSSWAKRTREANHLTQLFVATIREGHR